MHVGGSSKKSLSPQHGANSSDLSQAVELIVEPRDRQTEQSRTYLRALRRQQGTTAMLQQSSGAETQKMRDDGVSLFGIRLQSSGFPSDMLGTPGDGVSLFGIRAFRLSRGEQKHYHKNAIYSSPHRGHKKHKENSCV